LKSHPKFVRILISLSMDVLSKTTMAIIASALLFGLSPAAAQDVFVPVRAVLRTSPEAIENVVHLPPTGGALGLFLDESIGQIVEYRVDLDITNDSDGDGIADNDADNSFHSSYHSGGTFPVSLRPAPGELSRDVQLKVFDATGNISQARLTIQFDGVVGQQPVLTVPLQEQAPPIQASPPPTPPTPPKTTAVILADRDILHTGEQFSLRIEDAPAGTAQYQWDLQGDGQVDTQTNTPSVLLEPDAPGVLPVRVTFVDAHGKTLGVIAEKFTVELPEAGDLGQSSPAQDAVRIDVTTQEVTAEFRLVFNAPLTILQLEPTWDFGDGQRSYLLEPTHTYAQGGTYTVSVSLRDIRSKQEVASAETNVVVKGSGERAPKERSGVFALILKPFAFLFKIILFVLFLLLLFAGVVFLWLLQKAKKENIPVRELAERYRHKFLHEEEGQPAELVEEKAEEVIDVEPEVQTEEVEPAPMKIVEEPQAEESAAEETTPPPAQEEIAKEAEVSEAPAEPVVEPPPLEAPPKEPTTPEPSSAQTEEAVLPPWLAQNQDSAASGTGQAQGQAAEPPSEPPKAEQPVPEPEPAPPSPPPPPPEPEPDPDPVQTTEETPEPLKAEEPAPEPEPEPTPPPPPAETPAASPEPPEEPKPSPSQETSAAPSWLDQGLTGATEEEKKKVEEGVVATPAPEQKVETEETSEPPPFPAQGPTQGDDAGGASGTTGDDAAAGAQQGTKKHERSPEEQERIREKRRRYRKNKRARERAARENGGEQKKEDSDEGGDDDEPLAFIKAEDVPG